MRIFYAVHHHNWEDFNMYPSLVEMGHEVIRYDWGYSFLETKLPSYTDEVRHRVSEKMLEAVRKHHKRRPIDLFFSYLVSRIIVPDIIDEIRNLGIPTVNFHCNNVHQFHLVEQIAPKFDFCMFPEKQALEKYLRVGARPLYVPMGANPHWCRPFRVPRIYDVTFVGQRYGGRDEFIRELIRQGVDVRVWGAGWKPSGKWRNFRDTVAAVAGDSTSTRWKLKNQVMAARTVLSALRARRKSYEAVDRILADHAQGPVSNARSIQLFSRSRISLGFSGLNERGPDGQRLRHVRVRDYEGPMSRALYFVEYCEELEEFYELDKEVVTFRTPEELVEKVKYYLRNPLEGERVRQAGYERAIRDHTWVNRFHRLFALMGLPERS